jgi:SpoVK/Ycf46/Vps4 family AAA+-type ATPase
MNRRNNLDYSKLIQALDVNLRIPPPDTYVNTPKEKINVVQSKHTIVVDNKWKKEEMDTFLRITDVAFFSNEYGNLSFSGWDSEDIGYSILDINDPNLFKYNNRLDHLYHPTLFVSSGQSPRKMKIITTPKKREKSSVAVEASINSLDDIIQLTDKYPLSEEVDYNINMVALHNIREPLVKLNNMIGMKSMKMNIVDQILFYIQGLHKDEQTNTSIDFMHTVIYGPPGTGKTEIAKIIGSIFSKLGILKAGTFKKVTRSDLVAGYLGQTAIKTSEVIKECLGGCLFIDEAYALGNDEKRDSFSKECIDTLCEALSNHKEELMVIIAGYENELNKCFFAYNRGLDSRFTWRFKTDEYEPEELYQIFIKMVTDCGWKLNTDTEDKESIQPDWFIANKNYFKFYGRDIETVFAKTKIAHSRRVFCKPENEKRTINLTDLNSGFDLFKDNEEVKKRVEALTMNPSLYGLYV